MQRVRLAGVSRVSAGMNILPRVYVFSPKSTPAPVHNFAGSPLCPSHTYTMDVSHVLQEYTDSKYVPPPRAWLTPAAPPPCSPAPPP